MEKRKLGKSGVQVSPMGLGCWAIGGPFEFDGRPAGWGGVDDAESVRAIRRALDLGVTYFDTADVYGCGHSEQVLGEALNERRDEAVVATKFGLLFDEDTRMGGGADTSPAYIRSACEASLRRLETDRIDLYQLHGGADDATSAEGDFRLRPWMVLRAGVGGVGRGSSRSHGCSVRGPTCAPDGEDGI
jgi:aryl-alcohol dehydrogenase-like predicted oxidoreductase